MTTNPHGVAPLGTSLYERVGERSSQPFALMLLDKTGPLAGCSLIDVAGGTGGLGVVAAERGAQVLVTDINPAMVERSAERLRPYAQSEAKIMDFNSLRVADASYDVAISNFGVLAFSTWNAGLREMVRVLRPGGRIGLAMWTQEDDCSPAHLMQRVFKQLFPGRELWPAGFFPVFSEDELRDGLRGVGCTAVDVDVVEIDWSPLSTPDVVSECDPMFKGFPGYGGLSADEAPLLHGALQTAFDGYAGADGVIRLPTRAFMVAGRKV